MKIDRILLAFAALNGAMAVALGAFAAHGAGPAVKTLLTTGSHYQIVHALLAVVCALWPARTKLVTIGGWLSVSGGLIFALALSSIGLLGLRVMGAVAPIGGLLMIAAWLLLFVAAFQSHSDVAE
ncbi:DUF423 domain-containing protein [Brevundimonas kwangchunensis]|uniref:DUF423 domain-containing protein n=1 Tax=Brevundimonas kwangchunensis TaxID=322163 RepID=A0ABN1H0W5_9CAUL